MESRFDKFFENVGKSPELKAWEKEKQDIEFARGLVAFVSIVLAVLALLSFLLSIGIWAFGSSEAALKMLSAPCSLGLLAVCVFRIHTSSAKRASDHELKKPQRNNYE